MDKVDWKRKLSSRKFWVAVVGFVTAVAAAFGLNEANVGQITSIIMAGATLIAYILGESWVDAKAAETVETIWYEEEQEDGEDGEDDEWEPFDK